MVAPLMIAAGLLGVANLLGIGRSHWNAREQRQIYQRQEEYQKKQSADWDKWMSDYTKNTGVTPNYQYLGQSGQAEYLKQVTLPSYSNLYSQNNANVWLGGMQSLASLGATGAYGYYRNKYQTGYHPSEGGAGGRYPDDVAIR